MSIFFQGYEVLSKYVALYAANLIKDNNTLKALDLFCRYGAPANPQVRTPKQTFFSVLTVCTRPMSSFFYRDTVTEILLYIGQNVSNIYLFLNIRAPGGRYEMNSPSKDKL